MEENEVKLPLGGKGAKDSKDGGVEESFVSADKYTDIITLSSVISYLYFQPLLSVTRVTKMLRR